jgi:hypothetical protein
MKPPVGDTVQSARSRDESDAGLNEQANTPLDPRMGRDGTLRPSHSPAAPGCASRWRMRCSAAATNGTDADYFAIKNV